MAVITSYGVNGSLTGLTLIETVGSVETVNGWIRGQQSTSAWNVNGAVATTGVGNGIDKTGWVIYMDGRMEQNQPFQHCYFGFQDNATIDWDGAHQCVFYGNAGEVGPAEDGGIPHGTVASYIALDKFNFKAEIQSDGDIRWWYHRDDDTLNFLVPTDDWTLMDDTDNSTTFDAASEDTTLYWGFNVFGISYSEWRNVYITDDGIGPPINGSGNIAPYLNILKRMKG
jgi:hypothetical protein